MAFLGAGRDSPWHREDRLRVIRAQGISYSCRSLLGRSSDLAGAGVGTWSRPWRYLHRVFFVMSPNRRTQVGVRARHCSRASEPKNRK